MSLWGGSTTNKVYHVKMTILAVAFLAMSILIFVPLDLFTTALWLDKRDLVWVYSESAATFSGGGLWGHFNSVTKEAFYVSVGIFLAQVFIGHMSSASGGYTNRSSNVGIFAWNVLSGKEKLQPQNIKWEKFGWLLAYLLLASIDTFTDLEYRSGSWSGDILLTIVLSIGIYNLGSEWMLVRGFGSLIEHGPRLLPNRRQQRSSHASSQKTKPKPQQQKGKQGFSLPRRAKAKGDVPMPAGPMLELPELRRDRK